MESLLGIRFVYSKLYHDRTNVGTTCFRSETTEYVQLKCQKTFERDGKAATPFFHFAKRFNHSEI